VLRVTPASVRLLDNTKRDAPIAVITARMSDGGLFLGRLSIDSDLVYLKRRSFLMSTLNLSRALTPADDGSGSWKVTATDADGNSASVTIAYTIVSAQAPVFANFPAAVTIPDNSPAGFNLLPANATLANNDGSAFTGATTVVNADGSPATLVTFTP